MKKHDIVKQAKIINVAIAAIIVIAGAVLLGYPEMGIKGQKILFGTLCILLGCAKMVGYFSNDMYRLAFQFDFAIGIFSMLLGILIFIGPPEIREVLSVVIGAYIILDGTLKLQTALDAKRFGISRWWVILATAVLTALFGTAAVISHYTPFSVEMTLGAALIADGCENAWITAYTVRVRTRKKKH